MPWYEWLALALIIPTAIFLIVASVVSAIRMSRQDAVTQQNALLISIAVLMAVAASDQSFSLNDIPVIGMLAALMGALGAIYVGYTTIVSCTFVFRRRFRAIGLRMLVICTLALWWIALADPNNTTHQQTQDDNLQVHTQIESLHNSE